MLGGNEGDVMRTFESAKELIRQTGVIIKHQSSLYRTQAWGMNGNDFLNQALEIHCQYEVPDLMKLFLDIEMLFGRERASDVGYQSRTLDIDIIHAFEHTHESDDVIVPHPRLHLRKFVLVPLMELAPYWIHPILNKDCASLLDVCDDGCKVEKIS